MSTPGTITHRTPVTGVNNPAYQVSKNAYNDSLVVASAAPDGSVLVKDATQEDGWGAVPVLPPAVLDLSGVVPATRTVDGHPLTADVVIDRSMLVPITRTINGQPLSGNIVIGTGETGGVPFQRTVNGHPLSADVVVTKADVGLGNVENTALSTGNAATATLAATALLAAKLATPRTINGVAFDGSGNIVLPAPDLSSVVPIARTVNGKPLSANVALVPADLGLGNVPNIAPPGLDVRLYGAVGDGTTYDTVAIRLAIAAAGVNGTLIFPPGKTFLGFGNLIPLSGQTWWGYGAILKRCDQVSSTTATAIAIGSGTLAITVASAANFRVGMEVAVFNGATFDGANHLINSIVGNVLNVGTAFSVAFPSGGTVVSSFEQIQGGAPAPTGVSILGFEMHGNKANNTLINRWELHAEIAIFDSAHHTVIRDIYAHDCQSEGIESGGNNSLIDHCYIVDCNGNGIHQSTSSGAIVSNCYVKNCNLLGIATGHSDGCIIFSNATGDSIIVNNYCENGRTGIGSIDSDDDSGVIVANNICRNCLTAMDLQVPNVLAGRVIIANNQFYDCNLLDLQNTTASIATGNYSVIVNGNYFKNTRIVLSYATDISIVNNQLVSAADITLIGIEIRGVQRCLIANNHIRGFWAGVYIQNTAIAPLLLAIRGNTLINQYVGGVSCGGLAMPNGAVIQDNSILTDAAYASATYAGISASNGVSVIGNTLQLASGQYGILCPSGASGVQAAIVAHNVIRSTGITASIKAFGGSQNNIIKDNYTQQAIADGGAGANVNTGNLTIV